MPEWKQEIRGRLASLKLEPAREAAIVEELAQHLEDCYGALLAGGAPPAEAQRQTLAELSEREMLTRELRRVERQIKQEPIILGTTRRTNMIADLWQDLRYGVRMLLKHKGFTAVAVLSLALGIGANTAIFSLIDALLLKSLPVQDPQQLVVFSVVRQGGNDYTFNYPLIERFNQANHSFAGIIASNGGDKLRMSVAEPGGGGEIEPVQAEQVSGNYFSVLGVNAAAGRTLTEDDDRGPQPVAVISYDFWQRRFAADPRVVGHKITLNDFPFTVIGVAPRGFSGFELGAKPDLWWSLRMTPQVYPGRKWPSWLLVMGRLRPGAIVEQARAEMDAVHHQQLSEIAPERLSLLTPTERSNYFADRIELEPGGAGWTVLRKQFRQPLLILMAAVGLVMLIACANVANLLLARAAARQKEIAVRLALGAGRFRLIRQLLTESLLLALTGGALGLLFAYQGTRVLLTYLPQQRPVFLNLSPDARVLGFTLAVAVLTGILFGLAPALRATRLDLTTSLREKAGSGGSGRSRVALNKVLIVAQVALSLFLLIGAGLFVRSLQKLKGLDAGFDRENVMVFDVDPGHAFSMAQQVGLYKQLLARLEALPGARAVSVSPYPPLNGGMTTPHNVVKVPGYSPPAGQDTSCQLLWVGPKFFETMGIPLLQGRDFGPQEETPVAANTSQPAIAKAAQNATSRALLAAVINQAMAQFFFGNENPLGKHFDLLLAGSLKGISFQVIGVVKDAKYKTLREPTRRAFYVSYFQDPGSGALTFLLRTTGNPTGFGSAVQRAVRELEPRLQVGGLKTLDDVVNESLVQERFVAQLASFFSLSALLLACIGLYGIMSYAVTKRTNEIGIRMALGARGGDVVRLVMKETMVLVAVGVTIGLSAALATTRLVSTLLYGLTPNDPVTIMVATLLMIGVAALAGYLPARKASQVDPLVALRCE
ncbi:MAG: ABC transporter permease [Acidobacteriota bacterium]